MRVLRGDSDFDAPVADAASTEKGIVSSRDRCFQLPTYLEVEEAARELTTLEERSSIPNH